MSSQRNRDSTRKRTASLDPNDPLYQEKQAEAKKGKRAYVEPDLIDLKS